MGSMGASVLRILQYAIAFLRLVTQLVGSSVVFSVSFKSGLLCRERQTGSDHRCYQWHWAGGGRRARRPSANVAIVGRSKAKTRIAPARITAAAGRGRTVATFIADLSSQAAVRRLAAEVLDRYPKLDVLVNNAGAMYATRQLTTQRLVCGGGFVYVIHKGALVDVILGAEYQHFDLNAACGSASIRPALRRPSATLT
jgi:hypothetical protein